jgi:anti-sigma factor RsiW
MTCAEFEEVLPDLLDGSRNLEIEAHLESCPQCAELVSDLRAITEECKLLRASEEPPAEVWNSIQSTLRAEGIIRRHERPFLVPAREKPWAVRWLVPVAAVLVAGLAFFLTRPALQQRLQQNSSSQAAVSTSPASTQIASADDDDQQVLAAVSERAPMMEASYQDNLRSVNAYIADAQEILRERPNDDEARQYLLEAQQQKAMLYEMALDRSLP